MRLPEGYIRPSLADFVAAGYAADDFERFFASHEAQLSRHFVARNPEPLPEPEPPALLDVEAPDVVDHEAFDTLPSVPAFDVTLLEVHREDFDSPDEMLAAIEREILPADAKASLRAAAYDWALELAPAAPAEITEESGEAVSATSAPSDDVL